MSASAAVGRTQDQKIRQIPTLNLLFYNVNVFQTHQMTLIDTTKSISHKLLWHQTRLWYLWQKGYKELVNTLEDCLILANEGHSQYWERLSLATTTQPLYNINSLSRLNTIWLKNRFASQPGLFFENDHRTDHLFHWMNCFIVGLFH